MQSAAISEVRTPTKTQISQGLLKFLYRKSNQIWATSGLQTNKKSCT